MTAEQPWMLSMMTALITVTLAESALFLPLRQVAVRLGKFPGKLLSCGYCLAHWIGAGLVVLYQPELLVHPRRFLLTTMVVIWLAELQWIGMVWMMKASGK